MPRLALAILLITQWTASAALIPGIYNTGVDDDGNLLPAATPDAHYTLVTSPDAEYPGPTTYTLTPGWPVGPWLAEGPYSRWIAPHPEQVIGNAEGDYTFRTTFDLTGFDPSQAYIQGRWSSDNAGLDILLNGLSLGIGNPGGFGGFADFAIGGGFVAGLNTLDFVVNNAAPSPNPIGVRVELLGTVALEEDPPVIAVQPLDRSALVGDTVSFSVVAAGKAPLTYQWQRDGFDIEDATNATLNVTVVNTNQAGAYVAMITNPDGTTNSRAAMLTVYLPLAGLFNTGVDANGNVLADYAIDPHYRLVVNPDGGGADALVEDSTLFPIVAGPWLTNSATSKWIGPRGDTVGAAGGDYTYRLEIDLTGLDPTTAFLTGQWTSDNMGVDILLNGVSTGLSHGGNFDQLFSFSINSGFLSGTNTLEFKVNNASQGYTGLRVENLRGGALPQTSQAVPPRIVGQPKDQIGLTGQGVEISVVADGTPPLSYQWYFNDNPIDGQTDETLSLTGLTTNNTGRYYVSISNAVGSTNSAEVALTVLEAVPSLFSTGVDGTGALLGPGAPDPHYFLIVSPDTNAAGPTAYTLNPGFPVPPWVAEGPDSRWIAPQADQSVGNIQGAYVYATTFDLSGFDPTTAQVFGRWAADDNAADVILNGASLGLANSSGFGALVEFRITNGFVAGLNSLAFVVPNGGAAPNPTGLRVEVQAGALPAACIWPAPVAMQSASGQSNQLISVTLPAGLNATEHVTVTVASSQPAIAEPLGAIGGSLTMTFTAGGSSSQNLLVHAKAVGAALFTLTGPEGVCIGDDVLVTVGETLLRNPSFEENYNSAGVHYSAINQWRQIPGGGIGVNEADGPFHDNGLIPDRARVAFVQGTGGIYQPFWGLVPGRMYWLQYHYNVRNCCGGTMNLRVRLNGRPLDLLDNILPVGAGNPYYTRSVPFTAEAEYGLLEFATYAEGDASFLLDAVTIVPRETDDIAVMNPSFEASGLPAAPGYVNPLPMSGWVGTGNYGINRSGEGPFADNGLASDQRGVLFLQEVGSISQTLTGLEPGQRYGLSFAYNARDCCGGAMPHLSVTLDGNSILEEDVAPVGLNMPFHRKTVAFQATTSTATVTFQQTATGDTTLLLDDVHVAAVGATDVELKIRLMGDGSVRLSWPSYASSYVLEVSAAVPDGFVDIGLPSSTEGDETVVYDIVEGPAKFYRLSFTR